MILTDILKVLYQPHKVFKQIVQNPKYLGAIIVLLLFVAAQVAFQYTQYSKVYYEQTSPDINKSGHLDRERHIVERQFRHRHHHQL